MIRYTLLQHLWKMHKQEGAELCQAQPAKHKLFGSNEAIFFGLNCWWLNCWIVGLLNCWIIDLLNCWMVKLWKCWIVELLNCWFVELLNCWSVEVLKGWSVKVLKCWNVEFLNGWIVKLLNCYIVEWLNCYTSITDIMSCVLWSEFGNKSTISAIKEQVPNPVNLLCTL